MSKRSSTSIETKLHAIQRRLEHKSNPNYEARQLGVSSHTVREWIRKYRADGLDYQKAIEKYGVSYQQVYAWVRKYQVGSEDALNDNRGRKKPVEELDEHERLKLRIKELEARNEYLEMENAFAKKLAEIKGRNTC